MLNHKTIKTILTITALCLISLARAEEKESSKIELIPVYEKTFDDTIQRAIFDEAEIDVQKAQNLGRNYIGLKPSQKIKMLYPKVIITRKGIMFYSPEGELNNCIRRDVTIKNKKMITEVFVSENEKYIGLRKGIYDSAGTGRTEFEIYNEWGKKLWSVDVSVLNTGVYSISPNGEYFVAYGDPSFDYCDYIPSIWDKNGMRARLFPGVVDPRTHWTGEYCAFTPDGEKFVIGRHDFFANEAYLILYTKDGKKLWEKKVGRGAGGWRAIKISSSGRYIAAFITEESSDEPGAIILLDIHGNLLWKIPHIKPGTPDFLFSSDEEEICFINDWGFLYFIRTKTGEILWSFDKREEEEYFRSVTASVNARLLGIGVFGCKGRPDKIYLFNTAGNLLSEFTFVDEGGFTNGIPYVKFNSSGTELIYCRKNTVNSMEVSITGR